MYLALSTFKMLLIPLRIKFSFVIIIPKYILEHCYILRFFVS
jgi:hypothetical protein